MLLQHLFEGLDPADGTLAHELAVIIQHGDTGGVVTAVFKTPQAFEQQGMTSRSATAPTMPHMVISLECQPEV